MRASALSGGVVTHRCRFSDRQSGDRGIVPLVTLGHDKVCAFLRSPFCERSEMKKQIKGSAAPVEKTTSPYASPYAPENPHAAENAKRRREYPRIVFCH